MPAERSTKRKVTSEKIKQTEFCEFCEKVFRRKSDLRRHMKQHSNPTAKKLPYPWEGCTLITSQKSHLKIHLRRHTREKSHICTDDPNLDCKFRTCDPVSLHRHRKNFHKSYIPRSWSNSSPTAPTHHLSVELSEPFQPSSPACTSGFESPMPPSTPSESFSPPFGESGITCPRPSFNSSLPHESLPFPYSYDYACDTSLLSGPNFFTAEPNMEDSDLESQLFSRWHNDMMMVDTPDVMYYQPSLSEFYASLYAGNINFETPTSPYSNPTWLSRWFDHGQHDHDSEILNQVARNEIFLETNWHLLK